PFESKGGVSFLARKAQAAVIPVGAYGDHASRLNRWDQYQIPLPFTKMYMYFGDPIIPDKKADDANLLTQITVALSDARIQAQKMAGISAS
ncbi:MAG: hypothetical protein GY943_26585, partial [Chloroflexi bacterium]|nr:hypothetical protein [Chloroflexota bacterium]